MFPPPVPNIPTLTTVVRISTSQAKALWVPLTPDEARGVLTNLTLAYQPANNGSCYAIEEEDMQLMTIEENIDTQSEALIGDLYASLEYCVAIQVSTIAGESGFSNILKIQCEFVLFFFGTIAV